MAFDPVPGQPGVVDEPDVDEPPKGGTRHVLREAFSSQDESQLAFGMCALVKLPKAQLTSGFDLAASGDVPVLSDALGHRRESRCSPPGRRTIPTILLRVKITSAGDEAQVRSPVQKSTGIGTRSSSPRTTSRSVPMPSFSLILRSISTARSGLSRKNWRAFSLPWPN